MPGKYHGPRSLVSYRPWGSKEWDTTEQLHFTIIFPDNIPGGSVGKEFTCNTGDLGPIPGSGRFPVPRGRGHSSPWPSGPPALLCRCPCPLASESSLVPSLTRPPCVMLLRPTCVHAPQSGGSLVRGSVPPTPPSLGLWLSSAWVGAHTLGAWASGLSRDHCLDLSAAPQPQGRS